MLHGTGYRNRIFYLLKNTNVVVCSLCEAKIWLVPNYLQAPLTEIQTSIQCAPTTTQIKLLTLISTLQL